MTNTTARQTGKPPVDKFRIGLVQGAIWESETSKGTLLGATFERRYKDADGNYQSTQTFNGAGLLALSKLADLAHTKITALEAAAKAAAEQ